MVQRENIPPMESAFPIAYTGTGELFPLFLKILKLCKVKKSETIVLHSDSHTYPHYPAAFMGAAMELGADVYQIVHPRGVSHKSVVDIWKTADLVLDLSSYPSAYQDINREALLAGTRILRVGDEESQLRRLFPLPELRSRTEPGAEILTAGKQLRVQSDAGTDLTLDVTGRTADALYGIADTPGRWDLWPSGIVVTTAIEESATGSLILDTGDCIRNLDHYVRDPVRMKLQEGRIVEIDGGYEAWLLKSWFERFQDPNVYVVAHIGWGCDQRADWHKSERDTEIYYGNMQIAFGINVGHYVDGKNRAKGHIDFACLNNSVSVDDIPILEIGQFVDDRLK